MNNRELHLFILWEHARYQQERILTDIEKCFHIVKKYAITWSPEYVSLNFTRFYGVNLPNNSDKEQECGIGEFLLVIVYDEHPQYENRTTSRGVESVNVNMFEAKQRYREWTMGGHKVHCTNSLVETNHDLTLLLGLNVVDYELLMTSSDWSDVDEILHQNILGCGEWSNLRELFYVLNNTIRYCVLRNFESLPDVHDVSIHGDIDLLVDNLQNAVFILNARKVFPEPYRVYYFVKVNGQFIPFDLRHIGDDYYDWLWEKSILNQVELYNNVFYVPSFVDCYYSLLYHAYIQKDIVANDYPKKLSYLSDKIDIVYQNNVSKCIEQLDEYFSKNGYEYVRPKDKSVGFSERNLKYSQRVKKWGILISRLITYEDGVNLNSKVFMKNGSYIKYGPVGYIENEIRYLNLLNGTFRLPKVLAKGEDGENMWVEISAVEGQSTNVFFERKERHRPNIVRQYIKECISILKVLSENNVLHKDFIPQNIFVSVSEAILHVSVIDFAWATSLKGEGIKCPDGVGKQYRSKSPIPSDIYSFGYILREYWNKVPQIRVIADYMMTHYDTCDLNKLLFMVNRPYGLRDRFGFFLLRHKTVARYFDKFRHFIR